MWCRRAESVTSLPEAEKGGGHTLQGHRRKERTPPPHTEGKPVRSNQISFRRKKINTQATWATAAAERILDSTNGQRFVVSPPGAVPDAQQEAGQRQQRR